MLAAVIFRLNLAALAPFRLRRFKGGLADGSFAQSRHPLPFLDGVFRRTLYIRWLFPVSLIFGLIGSAIRFPRLPRPTWPSPTGPDGTNAEPDADVNFVGSIFW